MTEKALLGGFPAELRGLLKPVLAMALIALSAAASAVNLVLITHNQTSGTGTISTLITDGSHVSGIAPASTAVWDWDGTTLTSTGLFSNVSSLSSGVNTSTVLSDQIMDLTIDTGTGTASATSYTCVEGSFLSGVGANGCGGYTLGGNFQDESTTVWSGLTVSQTIGGDDVATGAPRTISAYDFNTVTGTAMSIGDIITIGNGIPLGGDDNPEPSGGELMTFEVLASAVDDSVSAPPNVLKNIPVLDNDLIRSPITDLTISSPPSDGGTVDVKPDNTIDYTSGGGFSGKETFEYSLTDPGDPGAIPPVPPQLLTATVTVTDGPDANDDTVKVVVGTTRSIDVLANDGGLSDAPFTVVAPVNPMPTLGMVSVTGSPGDASTIRVDYTAGMTTGADSFGYQVSDNLGKMDTATVFVTVAPQIIPVAVDDADSTFGSKPVFVTVLGNDLNLDDTPMTVTVTTDPSNGQIGSIRSCGSQEPKDCEVSYVADAGFVGTDTFKYMVTDAEGDNDTAMVTITVNEVPVAVNDTEFTVSGGFVTIPVLANDTGLGLPIRELKVNVLPSQGTAVVQNNNTILYTPSPGGSATSDRFDYKVTVEDANGKIWSDTASVDITIVLNQGAGVPGETTAVGPAGLGLLMLLPWLRRRKT